MTHRSRMSEVKFKVLHNALLLREFTTTDLVEATGLKPSSVQTQLQRMRQEGVLISTSIEREPKKHRSKVLYRLTDDPVARLALAKSVEAFLLNRVAEQPTSSQYFLGRELLNKASSPSTSELERTQLLDSAEEALEMAEEAEGGDYAPDHIRIYFQFERGRLAYFRGNFAEAKKLFETINSSLEVNNDLLQQSTEYKLLANIRLNCGPNASLPMLARCVLDSFGEGSYVRNSALASFLLEVLQNVLPSPNALVKKFVIPEVAQGGRLGVAQAVNVVRFNRVSIGSTHSTIMNQQDSVKSSITDTMLRYRRSSDWLIESGSTYQTRRKSRALNDE